jgi:ABC-2 type transport system ATP-binding protein
MSGDVDAAGDDADTGGGDAAVEDQAGDAAVRATGLAKSFGDLDVFADVSFALPADAATAIVGPNGSGKTTLLELIAGLAAPTSGDVTLSVSGPRPVGYLPQAPRFQQTATVRETLGFYGRLLPEEPDVAAALDRVGLQAATDRRTDALSGGMRRLLGVAVALLGAPPLVVLDEPTSGLDPQMTRQVFDVVSSLPETGQSVVFATHDLSRAAAADYLLAVAGGGVVLEGPPEEVVAASEADSLAGAFEAAVGERAVTPGVGGDDE